MSNTFNEKKSAILSRKRQKKNRANSYLITIGISLLTVVLGFSSIIYEEFIIGAFLLILGFAVGLRTFLRADEAKNPHNYDSTYVGKPLGYTRRFKVLLGLTVVMLVVTVVIGIESILPLIVTCILVIFSMMYYLQDVKGKQF